MPNNSDQSGQRKSDSGYERLESQIEWYDGYARTSLWGYRVSRVLTISIAAAIPLTAVVLQKESGLLTAVLGTLIVVIEGLQQLFQWHHNWINRRATCELLKNEKYSYLGSAGAYEQLDAQAALRLLVSRVEGIIASENIKWKAKQEQLDQEERAQAKRSRVRAGGVRPAKAKKRGAKR